MKSKLNLPQDKIDRARELADTITRPVQRYIEQHTTVSVERATLRCLGADGVDESSVPVPNVIMNALPGDYAHGTARSYVNALLKKGMTPEQLNQAIVNGLDIAELELVEFHYLQEKANELLTEFDRRVSGNVAFRNRKCEQFSENMKLPMLYLIVATGNIYEDIKQAQAAAQQGADVIAVIRTTAQSLLDYVPYGPTTEGFGGTYATQENFRIMRAALDEVGESQQRYIRLVNYCSGLCMPEIAAMGAMERLDMMLNDSMYGILFRDINMYRTFVDQHFSRMINSYAEIIINTGEDNYLTTSDAYEKAYTVLASQLINERMAQDAGLPANLTGLGHAFEMNPELRNGFLYEIAQAQMAREIFPQCPLKYMPPTKFMTGDIFKGYIMNTMFNFASKMTGQSIHLLGMMTEAIHTPHMQDRYLAVKNAEYVMTSIADLADEIEYKADGIIVTRANQVLDQTIDFLEQLGNIGLFDSIEQGLFAEVCRPKDSGKGLDGVMEKAPDYWNPVEEFLETRLSIAE